MQAAKGRPMSAAAVHRPPLPTPHRVDRSAAAVPAPLCTSAAQVSAVVVTPEGDIVSGSLDKTIRVWRGGECVQVRRGNSCSLMDAAAAGREVAACGRRQKHRFSRCSAAAPPACALPTQVLEGHEAAVLCLLCLPNGDLLSGSGDCTIKVWSGGKCTHTIAAHSDSVR